MNKIYRIVWSTATSTWVVASEFAKGDARGSNARGGATRCMAVPRGTLASIVALLLGFAHPAWAQSLFWDGTDTNAKALTLHDDVLGHARAALRVDRVIDAGNGAWRPWFAVGLEDTFGESASAVSVASIALPNEQVGQRWTFDAGLEATLHEGVTLFGAIGVANELNGTAKETRQARFGLRWNW